MLSALHLDKINKNGIGFVEILVHKNIVRHIRQEVCYEH